jgi:alkylation response protein AidB-like acyl-CoA dehydrogenase
VDFELNDEQRLVRETAREFTDNEIIPRARDNDRNAHFDLELVGKIAAQGYLGAIVPQEYGGAGLDYLTYGLIVEQVGRGDSSMRTVVSVQTSLVCSAILKWGNEEQKQHYLPKLCSGEWLGCFALTEPDTGSDAANQKTRARKSNGGWVINGSKMFISMGNHAKVALRPIRKRPTAASPASWSIPISRDSSPRRFTTSSACADRTRPRSRSTTSRRATTRCSAGSATASRWR